MTDADFALARNRIVEEQLIPRGVVSKAVLDAMRNILSKLRREDNHAVCNQNGRERSRVCGLRIPAFLPMDEMETRRGAPGESRICLVDGSTSVFSDM